MQYALTHYGHRFLLNAIAYGHGPKADGVPLVQQLRSVLNAGVLPCAGNEALEPLVERSLLQHVNDTTKASAMRLMYERNPLEHLKIVVFEYTTLCNLDCLHCRNSHLEAEVTRDPLALRRVVDAMLPLGIKRFDFIGGEVTAYGKGWLELSSYARKHGAASVLVITSGWFLEQRNFLAAGTRYEDDRTYLRALRDSGVTHVAFSLDGPAHVHDRARQVDGLYARVWKGIQTVREEGLTPVVSLVVGLGVPRDEVPAWIASVARQLDPSLRGSDENDVKALLSNPFNYVSNFIDVGGGVKLRRSRTDQPAFTSEQLRCKNFFRPSPRVRIGANGEVSLCPLVEGGEGYGNVFQRDIVDILNHMHEALVYKLHAERNISAYMPLLDNEIFQGQLGHVCTARTALNMLAQRLEARGLSPHSLSDKDRDVLRECNLDVAQRMGIRPRPNIRRANGHPVP